MKVFLSEQIEDLAMIVTDQVFRKGETIFSEGEDGNGFYVVITGRVKIFKLSSEGKEQILHFFGPGEPFGEVPVFTGQHFPANAEAMEESRVFFFPRKSFVDLIKRNPSLALNMLAVLSKRLRRFAALIDDLSLKGSSRSPGRVPPLPERPEQGDKGSRAHHHQSPARKPFGHHSGDSLPHSRKIEFPRLD